MTYQSTNHTVLERTVPEGMPNETRVQQSRIGSQTPMIGDRYRWKTDPFASGRARGVTFVELMVVLVVLAILMGMAVPSFEIVRNSSRLAAQTNELVTAVQLARSEAVTRRQWVSVCRSDDGTTCAAAATSWDGWMVFVDTNRDGARQNAEDRLRVGEVRAPVSVLASNSLMNNLVTFRPDGFARNGSALLNATISVCIPTTKPSDNRRLLTIASGSRVAVEAANGNGTCVAP
ncbi:GspH/FimT family pseudopilin [Lysobacter sp. LF1]|uniref:Type II secretion system protein H n=1 Tax=Lysobacter stagni TaxID=3045172 RepID=A0ABT6XIW2_9GAMM|nr:GspH/FimT family pseudopilin [Lysobacter sp. LF1]MDI9239898.1 GspH/FimT family pseudopilin [Lysobacter sp. LF1]